MVEAGKPLPQKGIEAGKPLPQKGIEAGKPLPQKGIEATSLSHRGFSRMGDRPPCHEHSQAP